VTNTIRNIIKSSPVIPVLVIERLDDAVPLAQAIVKGGLKVLEITLRTSVAIAALTEIKKALPEAIVGAGTVIDTKSFDSSLKAGADFIVSPGSTPTLIDAARANSAAFLPGASTPSEVLRLLEYGFNTQKFFPAEAAGGVEMLKAINGPLPQVTFCPTGGITLLKAGKYLACKNVACVGGSWIATRDWINEKNWQQIENAARGTLNLRNPKFKKC